MKKLINKFLKYQIKTDILEPFVKVDEKYAEKYIKIKTLLDAAKSQLDEISKENYFELMRYMDIYLNMKRVLKSKYNMQICTNASLKMYEMICECNLIKSPLIAFCNAEFPGAFIASVNHYCITNHIKFQWFGGSYISGDNTTLDDKYGIYKRHMKNWLMDSKNNGDVTILKNNEDYARKVKNINLYTSDAGIDVSEDYNSQEEITIFINYGQILSGLLTLDNGGNFVTKQYTYFNPFTRSIMTILSYLFEEFYITKPATSRPSNSETYLIGINYQKDKLTSTLKKQLCDALENKDLTPLCKINESMYESTYDIHEVQQVDFLNELYFYYKNPCDKYKLYDYYNILINNWIKKYNIKYLQTNEYL